PGGCYTIGALHLPFDTPLDFRLCGGVMPTLYLIVFSNFEGFCTDPAEARRITQGVAQVSRRFPETIWTHMFNPVHLLGNTPQRQCEAVFIDYLRGLKKKQPATETGLHLHMFKSIPEALGVMPRSLPSASGEPSGGYDVLLTGYTAPERAQLIEGCVA